MNPRKSAAMPRASSAPSGGFGSTQSRFPALRSRGAVAYVQEPVDSKFVLCDTKADGLRTRIRHNAVPRTKPASRRGSISQAQRRTSELPKIFAEDLERYSYYDHAKQEEKQAWHRPYGPRFQTAGREFKPPKPRGHVQPAVGTYTLQGVTELQSNFRNSLGTKPAYKAKRAAFNSTTSRF
eukprot:m.467201 g.467201  ORF g.467201 m.467201 type:complete len:181 (-) comp26049_c0_seq1:249-791(-)